MKIANCRLLINSLTYDELEIGNRQSTIRKGLSTLGEAAFAQGSGRIFSGEYQDMADQQFFLIDERVREIFGTNEPFILLLRPDNQIAFLSTGLSLERVRAYLDEFLFTLKA